MQYAHNVFATDPEGATHFDSRACTPSEERNWNDFDRFEIGQCMAFSAQIVSSVSVYIAGAPGLFRFMVRLTINSTMVTLFQGSRLLASSTMPMGVAPGMPGLVGDFWICMTDSSTATATSMQFQYGRGDVTVLDVPMAYSLGPKYFALGCDQPVSFVTIGVYAAEAWKRMVKMKSVCFIDNCLQYQGAQCVCMACVPNFMIADSGKACVVDPKCKGWSDASGSDVCKSRRLCRRRRTQPQRRESGARRRLPHGFGRTKWRARLSARRTKLLPTRRRL